MDRSRVNVNNDIRVKNRFDGFYIPSGTVARSYSRVLVSEVIKCCISDLHCASKKRLLNTIPH